MKSRDTLLKLEIATNTKITPNVRINPETNAVEIITNDDTIAKYDPTTVPAVWSFLQEDIESKIFVGPYNSGKTSAMVNFVLRKAITMPFCNDGVRRYKVVFIRNTAADLETTTLNTWLYWTRGLPTPHRNKRPVLQYFYNFFDDKGKIEMQVMFLGLDRPDDYNKLASLEVTDAIFNELQFIPQSLFQHMQSRIGRYPSKIEYLKIFDEAVQDADITEKERKELYRKWLPYQKNIFADTNPPEDDHYIPSQYEKKQVKSVKVYHQPEGILQDKDGKWQINPNADNFQNLLDENYYLKMLDHGEEYARVYAQGKYGTVVDGKPVYTGYNDDFHSIAKIPLEEHEGIGLFIDLGTVSPAVLLMQYVKDQVRCLKEFIGEFISLKELMKASVLPWLHQYAKGQSIETIQYDPADTYDGGKQLAKLGLEANKAMTNLLAPRLSAVKNILNQLIGGKPRFIVSREGCPRLRQGFLGKYYMRRLRVVGEERYEEKPFKNHPYSDIQDCCQYGVMHYIDSEPKNPIEDTWERQKRLFNEKDRNSMTGY